MCAGDDKRSVAGKKEFLERFRERAVRNLVVEHVFDLGIPTREGVADDDKVWLRLQMVLAEALLPGDRRRLQQMRGWRIDACVRARDVIPALLQHAGQRGHRRTADADQVDVFDGAHETTAGSRTSSLPGPEASRRTGMPRGTVNIGRGV